MVEAPLLIGSASTLSMHAALAKTKEKMSVLPWKGPFGWRSLDYDEYYVKNKDGFRELVIPKNILFANTPILPSNIDYMVRHDIGNSTSLAKWLTHN